MTRPKGVKNKANRLKPEEEFGLKIKDWLYKNFDTLSQEDKIKIASSFSLKALNKETDNAQAELTKAQNDLIAQKVREELLKHK